MGKFTKGISGNPGGRPPKPKNRVSPYDIVVARQFILTQDGLPRHMTAEEALQRKTFEQAMAGKRIAIRQVLKMISARDSALKKEFKSSLRSNLKIETLPSESINPALALLDIIRPDDRWDEVEMRQAGWVLSTWAVQAALNRRGSVRKLNKVDAVKMINGIKHFTLNSQSLVWPRRLRK